MSGVTSQAPAGDVLPPSVAERLKRLGDAAAWTEEPAKRIAEVVASQPPAISTTITSSENPESLKTAQDAKTPEVEAETPAEAEKSAVEALGGPAADDAQVIESAKAAETVISEKQDPAAVEVEQASITREAFAPGLNVIDSMQVAALRISGPTVDHSEEDAAQRTPPPAPTPAPAPVDPVAALTQSLSPEVLAQLALLVAGNAAAQPAAAPQVAAAAVDPVVSEEEGEEEEEEEEEESAAQPAPAKATRRRKRQLPWEDQSSSPLTKRFTMEVPIELHNRLQFIAGTTFGSNMTYFTLEALAPVLEEALRDRGFDPEPLDLGRLLNKRGKHTHG